MAYVFLDTKIYTWYIMENDSSVETNVKDIFVVVETHQSKLRVILLMDAFGTAALLELIS